MEEDLFILLDRDGDCLVTLDDAARCFESLGFIRDADEIVLDARLAAHRTGPLDVLSFSDAVRDLCACAGVRLRAVLSVCVEQSLYAAFCARTTGPDLTVTRSAMDALTQKLFSAGEPPAPVANGSTAVSDFFDYGAFVDFLRTRWPHLSRARLAALLRQFDSPDKTQTASAAVKTQISNAAENTDDTEVADTADGVELDALLTYAATLKAQLTALEDIVEHADNLEAANASLRDALAVAKEERAAALESQRAAESDCNKIREECLKYNQGPEKDFVFSEELSQRIKSLRAQESALVREDLSRKQRWTEAFLRRERALQRREEKIEIREKELAASEAALASARHAQMERERAVGDVPIGERRRRMQQLQRMEKALRSREEQLFNMTYYA